MPYSGTVNGYTYEYIDQNLKGAWYKLTFPNGNVFVVVCKNKKELDELTTDPLAFWTRYQGNCPIH